LEHVPTLAQNLLFHKKMITNTIVDNASLILDQHGVPVPPFDQHDVPLSPFDQHHGTVAPFDQHGVPLTQLIVGTL
jgi:hypothetical protein